MSRSLYIPLLNGTEQVAVPLEALPEPSEFLQLLRDERCSIRTWLKCAVSRIHYALIDCNEPQLQSHLIDRRSEFKLMIIIIKFKKIALNAQ